MQGAKIRTITVTTDATQMENLLNKLAEWQIPSSCVLECVESVGGNRRVERDDTQQVQQGRQMKSNIAKGELAANNVNGFHAAGAVGAIGCGAANVMQSGTPVTAKREPRLEKWGDYLISV